MRRRIFLALFLSLSTAHPVYVSGEDKKMGAKADHDLDGTHSHEETHSALDQRGEKIFSNNEIVMGDIDISASVSGDNISIGHQLAEIGVSGHTHDHEHLDHAHHDHAHHGDDHHIHGMSQEDILILNVRINEIEENLNIIEELTAAIQYIADVLNAMSSPGKKRSADEQSSDETKLLELVDRVTNRVENCENRDICESNEIIDITKTLTSTFNKMKETGTFTRLFKNSFFKKKIKLDTAISAAEYTLGKEKAKALRALAIATKIQFQLKGETGEEKVTISMDGNEEEFRLTTKWQTFSYPRPYDGFFSLELHSDNGARHVYIQGHESQLEHLLPDFTYAKAWGCGTQTENESCRDLREGYLAWNGKYTYTLKSADGWWSKWDHCSKECGGGKQTRRRTCTNLAPHLWGLTCEDLNIGDDTETRDCNLHHCGCIVEGGVIIRPEENNVQNGGHLGTNGQFVKGQFECSSQCYSNPDCVAWTMRVSDNRCWLKTVYEGHTYNMEGWITGTKECGIPAIYTMSGMECSVQEKVAEIGTNLWADKSSKITQIPPELEGTTLLQADQDEGKLGFILQSSQPAVAYVALHQNRDGGLALGDWTLKNGLSVEWDGWAGANEDIEKKLHKVYSKFMKADEDVIVMRNPQKIRDVLTFASFIKLLPVCRTYAVLTEDCYCKKGPKRQKRTTDNNGHDGQFCSKDRVCNNSGYCTNGFA